MHDTQDNLMTSLELHLFFARIMKERVCPKFCVNTEMRCK